MVPVISLGQMNEAERRAYIIADNKLAADAEWSTELLRSELSGLIKLGYDVELTGFDTFEIDGILSFGDDDTADDDVVELPADGTVSVCRVGDLWVVGKHKLIVGDARDPRVYARLLGDEAVAQVVMDPPYGCAIETMSRAMARSNTEIF